MEFHYKSKLKYSFMIFTVDISSPFLPYEFQTHILVKTYFLRYGCTFACTSTTAILAYLFILYFGFQQEELCFNYINIILCILVM